MATIKAKDLKVGMQLANNTIVSDISEIENGRICVTTMGFDYDQCEAEYYPVDVDLEEEFEI